MIRKFLFATLMCLPLISALAQDPATDTTAAKTETPQTIDGAPQQQVEMADVMRSEGKIYVVVGIVAIVLAIMFLYLFTIDRKVKKLENQLSEKGK